MYYHDVTQLLTEQERTDTLQRISPSGVILVLANLIPLGGVLLLAWEVFPVVLLYWLENVIVGVYNVARLIWARPNDVGRWVAKLFMIPFFTFHYGMFTLVHGVFVFAIFGGDLSGGEFISVTVIRAALSEYGIVYAALALFASHGFSFFWNYIRMGEYRRVELQKLMQQPYSRVVVLHLTIIGGGFLVMAVGSPTLGLLLLVVLKTGVDWRAHLKERKKLGPETYARLKQTLVDQGSATA